MPVIIPHFGAGFFREALMAADIAPNILLDTSSSNSWIRYHPGLTLADVFARALDVRRAGAAAVRHRLVLFPARLAARRFTTTQREILDRLDVDAAAQAQLFGGNFSRVFEDLTPYETILDHARCPCCVSPSPAA